MLRVLSLGAGVQSTTIALLAEHGEVPPIDMAVFADTHWETDEVYRNLDWIEERISYRLVRASAGSLREASLIGASGGAPWYANGGRGMLRRQCTSAFKVRVVQREIRKALGIGGITAKQDVRLVLGISTDEAHRMKDSRVNGITHEYPLIDLGMSRTDCLAWMVRQGFPEPPRSACVNCPYRTDANWAAMRANDPKSWAQACADDRRLAERGLHSHRSGELLENVKLDVDESTGDLFGEECEGMCGV